MKTAPSQGMFRAVAKAPAKRQSRDWRRGARRGNPGLPGAGITTSRTRARLPTRCRVNIIDQRGARAAVRGHRTLTEQCITAFTGLGPPVIRRHAPGSDKGVASGGTSDRVFRGRSGFNPRTDLINHYPIVAFPPRRFMVW